MSKTKTYADRFEAAITADQVRQVTAEIVRWEEPEQSILGEVVNISLLQDGKFEGDVNVYHILSDDGLKSCVLGSATDAQIKDKVNVHDVVRITYQGKVELADGKSANKFKIEVVGGKGE